MSQTTVEAYQDKWQAGQVGTSHYVRDVSVISEDSTAIDFGQLVIRGTTDPELGVKKPTATFSQKAIRGIVIKPVTGAVAKRFSDGVIQYNTGDELIIAEEGDIPVLLGSAVTAGQDVYFNHSGGGVRAQYTWGVGSDGGNADQVPGEFLESGGTGDIVLIRFNLDAVLGS